MERIMIIGCGCSGKSTLAVKLGALTGIPVVHLDKIWWSPGNWQHLDREEFDRYLYAEIEKPRWILDGNYNRTIHPRLERADTVIYLDYSRITCLLRWVKRVVQNWGNVRPDMGPECGEWFDPEFARWLWSFNRNHRKQYHQMLAGLSLKNVYIFKNPRQLEAFLKRL